MGRFQPGVVVVVRAARVREVARFMPSLAARFTNRFSNPSNCGK